MADLIVREPSLIPMATWPALFTATPRACWFGGKTDRLDAPPILYFFPAFWFIVPYDTTFLVFGLNSRILLSSAVVYIVFWLLIARPHVSPVLWPCMIYFFSPVDYAIDSIFPPEVATRKFPLKKSRETANEPISNVFTT